MRNKTGLVISIIFLILVGGAENAWAKKRKAPSPEQAATLNKKTADQQILWKEKLGLACPMGGAENVTIHSTLVKQYEYWDGGNISPLTKFNEEYPRHIKLHRAKNPYTTMTVDIRVNGGETVVSNLCPEGSITLVQSMLAFGGELRVTWTAAGIIDGRPAYDYGSPSILYQGPYNLETAKSMLPTWVIDLKVGEKF